MSEPIAQKKPQDLTLIRLRGVVDGVLFNNIETLQLLFERLQREFRLEHYESCLELIKEIGEACEYRNWLDLSFLIENCCELTQKAETILDDTNI